MQTAECGTKNGIPQMTALLLAWLTLTILFVLKEIILANEDGATSP
jgi:hypothetical protein